MDVETAREQQRQEWALSAPGWLSYRTNLDAPGGQMTPRLLAAARPRPTERVLDLACGIGNPSCALAERVTPGGQVLGLDLSPDMIENARKWAEQHDVPGVEFRVIPSEAELGVPPNSFDIATCRVGLQYMPDPVAALRAVHTALKPRGRMVATTLGSPEHCMAFRISSAVISRHAPTPPPAASGRPGPVSLSDPGHLANLFREAGFTEVEVDTFTTTIIEIDSPEACWRMFEETMGPMMRNLEQMPAQARAAMRADGIATLAREFPSGPVRLGGEVLIAAGTKPA